MLFATTQEADFSALFQPRVRDAHRDDGPLWRLLRVSLSAQGTREMQVGPSTSEGDWTVVQRSFRLLA